MRLSPCLFNKSALFFSARDRVLLHSRGEPGAIVAVRKSQTMSVSKSRHWRTLGTSDDRNSIGGATEATTPGKQPIGKESKSNNDIEMPSHGTRAGDFIAAVAKWTFNGKGKNERRRSEFLHFFVVEETRHASPGGVWRRRRQRRRPWPMSRQHQIIKGLWRDSKRSLCAAAETVQSSTSARKKLQQSKVPRRCRLGVSVTAATVPTDAVTAAAAGALVAISMCARVRRWSWRRPGDARFMEMMLREPVDCSNLQKSGAATETT